MGDTGSLILGVFLAAMIIRFNELNDTAATSLRFPQAPLIALALMIVPVTDTLRVFMIRIMNKRSPFSPDMNHFHHLLIKSGLTHIQSTCFLLGYTLAFTGLALLFSHLQVDLSFSFPMLLSLSFILAGLIWFKTKQLKGSMKNTKTDLALIKIDILRYKPRVKTKEPAFSAHEDRIIKIRDFTDWRKHLNVGPF
jgi:hypothetical protein